MNFQSQPATKVEIASAGNGNGRDVISYFLFDCFKNKSNFYFKVCVIKCLYVAKCLLKIMKNISQIQIPMVN